MLFRSGLLFACVASSVAIAVEPNLAIAQTLSSKTFGKQFQESRVATRLQDLYPEHNISVPIDHFQDSDRYTPHSNDSYDLRYFFDASNYKPGGPVFVLQSGETSAVGRLPFLQKGLIQQLAQATGGIAVVLEHRYYGTSWPVPDLSTENMRFLTTEQALADEAYFAQNVVFPGLEDYDLTAPTTAWIGYGGSYAGAFNAFLRVEYPDIFWGAISSSGVVEAIYDYWAYFEPIRVYGPQPCIEYLQKLTHVVDNILIGLNDSTTTTQLKTAFGLPNVTHDTDFAEVLTGGVLGWQSQNWDPEQNDPTFNQFCGNLSNTELLYAENQDLTKTVAELLEKGGYGDEVATLTTPMLNYIGYLEVTSVARCGSTITQDECFSNYNSEFYSQDDLGQHWRSWPYQYCTEWGYLATGSGVPTDRLPIISRILDLEYRSVICEEAFNITTPSDVSLVNKYGGFNLAYPRLAMIDGEWDPWRPATAHASPFNETALNRTNTASEPFIMIDNAIHHWDENGLFLNETVGSGPEILPPPAVKQAQEQELEFVLEWLQEWKLAQMKIAGEEENNFLDQPREKFRGKKMW